MINNCTSCEEHLCLVISLWHIVIL